MGGKFKLKRKDVKPSLKDKEVDARMKEPLSRRRRRNDTRNG